MGTCHQNNNLTSKADGRARARMKHDGRILPAPPTPKKTTSATALGLQGATASRCQEYSASWASSQIAKLNNEGVDLYEKGACYERAAELFREAQTWQERQAAGMIPYYPASSSAYRMHTILSHKDSMEGIDGSTGDEDDICAEVVAVASEAIDSAIPPTTSYIYQRMDFDEGMHAFSQAERLDDVILQSSDSIETTSRLISVVLLFNIGQVHRRLREFDDAGKFYVRAWKTLLSSPSVSTVDGSFVDVNTSTLHPVAISILHNIGQMQYRRGKLPLAINTYAVALAQAKRIFGDKDVSVATALNSLGVLHYHMSSEESERAMELFRQSLVIRTAALGRDHEDVATTLNNMGRIHVQSDEFDEALKYYEDALRIRAERLGRDSLDYAATAFNAGQSFHQKGQLNRALELYQEFLRVALIKFSKDHRDVAVVLSGIAQIHQERKDYVKALELYEESLRAGKAALGEYHSEVAMLLNRIGNFHFERENLDAALQAYRDGLRIERHVLDPDHPNIVVTLSNLGEIHRQRSEWDDAIRLYQEALQLQKQKFGTDHADIASTMNTIGLIYDQKGDTYRALQFFQESLLMRRAVLGDNHLDLSATLTYTGTILYRKNMLGVAMDLFSESLRIRTSLLGRDHRDVAFTMYNIALVHQQRGSYDEAIECYTETLRVEKLVLGSVHRDVAMTLFKLGEAYKLHGDLDNALANFNEALAIERNTSGSEDPTTFARTLSEIGNIHLARGEVVLMMEAFNEAARIYLRAGLSPNNLVISGQLYAFDVSYPEAAPAA